MDVFYYFYKKKDSKITEFSKIYDPAFYHLIINSIDEFAGVNTRTGHYETAGNATELTKHIKYIGQLLRSEYIITQEAEKKKNVDDFLTLCTTGFSNVINKTAMETLVARQREKVVELPSSSDILILSEYLDKLIDNYYEKLKIEFSYPAWRKLSEAVLSRMQVFNRRRSGESERLEISDMKTARAIKEDDEDYNELTEDEKKSAQEYVRVVIRGKLNANVPVLLKKRWLKAIKLIVKYRKDAGVSKRNSYVFGIQGRSDESYLSATKLLHEFSIKCGAVKPKLLRGTTLRKHAATKCAQFGLDDTNTAHFAKFMGHDINIHKNIYQQPVLKKDILSISKVLEKAQTPRATVTSSTLRINTNLHDISSSLNESNDGCENLPEPEQSFDTINTNAAENSLTDDSATTSFNQGLSHDSQKFLSNECDDGTKHVSRTPWTREEMKTLKLHFNDYLKSKTLPPLPTIRNIQYKFGVFKNRTPKVIKAQINNINKKNKSPINDNNEKTNETNAFKERIIRHVKFTFKDYIKKKKVPALDVCATAKKNDKILNTLSDTHIQKRVRQLIHN